MIDIQSGSLTYLCGSVLTMLHRFSYETNVEKILQIVSRYHILFLNYHEKLEFLPFHYRPIDVGVFFNESALYNLITYFFPLSKTPDMYLGEKWNFML